MTEIVGYLAALLTTVAFLPQLIKTWKTKSAGDLSVGMLAMFTVGVALWLVYGIALHSVPIVAANTFTLGQSAALFALRLRYGRR